MENDGKAMAEMGQKSALTDEELVKLIDFYKTVIGFLDEKGERLTANWLRLEMNNTFESFQFHRKFR